MKKISSGNEMTSNYGNSSCPWRSRPEDLSASSSEESCSYEHYVPDSAPSSDSDDCFTTINNQKRHFKKHPTLTETYSSKERTVSVPQPRDTSCFQQENKAVYSSDESGSDGDNVPDEVVPKPKGSRCTNKNYCYVCGKSQSKIARHLLKHKDEEPDIAEAFALRKNSKERKTLLEKLRNKGNYQHNQEVLQSHRGQLKLKRRPASSHISLNTKQFVHCLYCKGMFLRKELWRHMRRCPSKPAMAAQTTGRTKVLALAAVAESTFSQQISSGVWKMLVNMKQDDIASVVQNDFLILQLAQCLYSKHGQDPTKYEYIRQKLREMGRLLLTLRKKSSICSFEDATKPNNFYKVIEAVREVSGFDEEMNSYRKPSLALKLGHSLKKIGDIVLCKARKDDNKQMIDEAQTFTRLCSKEWTELFPHTALATVKKSNFNKPSTLPFTRDVQLFYQCIETKSAKAVESLKMYECPPVYAALAKVTLAKVIIFNNRRGQDISKMTLKSFKERDQTELHEDRGVCLSQFEQKLSKVEVMSQGDRKVVLLTPEVVNAITLLVNKRDACGIHGDNPFLFARPNCPPTSSYQGQSCIRILANECSAQNPEYLRSTCLRKHIATLFQILHLKNNELDRLADLLGHDIRIDRDFYQLPEATTEIAKISKLLLAAEKGSLAKFQGKSLEEIEIEDELEPDVEGGDAENGVDEEDNEKSYPSRFRGKRKSKKITQDEATSSKDPSPSEDCLSAMESVSTVSSVSGGEPGRTTECEKEVAEMKNDKEGNELKADEEGEDNSLEETPMKSCVSEDTNMDTTWMDMDTDEDIATMEENEGDGDSSDSAGMPVVTGLEDTTKQQEDNKEMTSNYGDSSRPWGSKPEDLSASSSEESCSYELYVPDSAPSSDSDDCFTTINNQKRPHFKKHPTLTESYSSKERTVSVPQPRDTSCFQQENKAVYSSDESGSDGDNVPDEVVPKPKGSRCTNKNYCYVCGKALSKIARHLLKHKDEEPDIAEAFALRKNSKERKTLLEKLRNKGNYQHNQEVLQNHRGQLKLKRRPASSHISLNTKQFVHCLYCKGMFLRKELWRHMHRCPSKPAMAAQTTGRTKVLALAAVAESTFSQQISSGVWKMLVNMKQDDIASVVKKDFLILQLAQSLYSKHGQDPSKYEYIRQKLREMGRLLLTLRKKSSICSFEDAIKPNNFYKVIEAVREVSGFDEEMNSYRKPSLALKLGHSLKKIGDIVLCKALTDDNKQMIDEAQTFTRLCSKEWTELFPHTALATVKKSNFNKPSTLPFTRDVQLFYQCIETKSAKAVESLKMYECPPVYAALAKVTLAKVIIFNNRRGQDISKMTLKSFKERDQTELHEDRGVCLSQFEQKLSKVEVMSQGDRKVAVLLTPELVNAITLLVNKRDACDVHGDNPFLFARPNCPTSSYQGQSCIRILANECSAQNPEYLRSTCLRKHIATLFQILHLKNNELDQLADFLGHDIRIDRDFYQLPEATTEIAKISKLLLAAEKGSLAKFQGKSLEEIEIEDELEPDVEGGKAENGVDEEDNEKSYPSRFRGKRKSKKITQDEATSSKDPSPSEDCLSAMESVSTVSSVSGGEPGRTTECEKEVAEMKNDKEGDEKDNSLEETPMKSCVSEDTNMDTTWMDLDMDLDMDIDTDEDFATMEESEGDGDSSDSAGLPGLKDTTKQQEDNNDIKKDTTHNMESGRCKLLDTTANDLDETTGIGTEEQEAQMKEGEQKNLMDKDSSSSSRPFILNTGRDGASSAVVNGMKEVRLLIPKLNIEKWQAANRTSQASSLCSTVSPSVSPPPVKEKDQPVHEECDQARTSTASNKDKPSTAKDDLKIGSVFSLTGNSSSPATETQTTPPLLPPALHMVCSHCKKNLMKGQTAYQRKGSSDVFCSTSCLSATLPLIKPVTKNCYNCLKVITRPQDIILAPVDATGTMKELCSQICLSCVSSKWNDSTKKMSLCSMCNQYCIVKCEVILNGAVHKICSSACFVRFGTINSPFLASCGNCGSFCQNKPLMLKMEDGNKTLCTAECLAKFKEKIKTPQPCSMCQTSRLVSDMVENKNGENVVELFCASSCVMACKNQTVCESGDKKSPVVSDTEEKHSVLPQHTDDDQSEDKKVPVDLVRLSSSPSCEATGTGTDAGCNGIKEVNLSVPKLDIESLQAPSQTSETSSPCSTVEPSPSPPPVKVKEEVKDEEYDQAAKDDLKISSVFSVTGNSSSPATEMQTATPLLPPALHMVCSHCKKNLMKGQTAYQRKGFPDVFCSTSCLSTTQIKPVTNNCHYCLKVILQSENIILAPVDANGTKKDFCSQTCVSSFNYKRIISTKIPLQPKGPQSLCSMCSRYCISKHEVILKGDVHKLCSSVCFDRFHRINKLSMAKCGNCGSHCQNKPLTLKMEDGNKSLCTAECLAKFKEKIKTPQPCAMCHTSKLMSDMVENKNSVDVVDLFCTSSCVMAYKIQTVRTSGDLLSCDSCGEATVPAYHVAMSDTSIKNFCTPQCVTAFQKKLKTTQMNTPVALTQIQTPTPNQTQPDVPKAPAKLPCSQCYQLITTKPKLIQIKDKLVFVCSLACCQEYKKVNCVTGLCEYCKMEKISRDVKRIDNKDCHFCSDGCKLLYKHDLAKNWGKHCRCCAYCFSISKVLVTGQYGDTTEEFCSDDCMSKYSMLFCHVAQCDTCGRKRKLTQTLPMLGEVKHFCDLSCLLHFCSRKTFTQNQVVTKGTLEATPVIANVVSLASAPTRQPNASASTAQQGTVLNVETKILGHASTQTGAPPPKVLKNKALLCRPLVENKGVSCTTETVDTEAQTDDLFPKVVVLPVPVPVFVPVPLSMYSQYIPKLLGLPIPLPVPMFLPAMLEHIMETVQQMSEKMPSDPSDPFEAEVILMTEMAAEQDERDEKKKEGQKDGVVEKERDRPEAHAPDGHTSNFSDDLDTDDLASFLNNWEDPSSDAGFRSPSRPYAHEKLRPILDVPVGMPSEPYSEPPPSVPPPMDIEADFTVETLELMAQLREQPQRSPSPPPAASRRRQAHRKARDKNKGRKSKQSAKTAEVTSQRGCSSKAVSREPPRLKSLYGIDAWKSWIQWRETQPDLDPVPARPMELKEDVLRCTTAELSYGLCRFIAEVKRPNGEPYSPDSLFYLCLGIQQYLLDNGCMENIFTDLLYSKFSMEFTKILKDFKPKITASGYVHSRVEEEYLWDCKQLGAYSPIVLLNTLLFFCCKYFGFTTVEQHRQLSFAHVMRCTKTSANNTKTTFLRFYPPISMNEQEEQLQTDADGVPAKKRKVESKEEILEMVQDSENPLRCPVRLYEFYLSKCSETIKQRTNLFYLHPERSCVPSSPMWFSSTPLDDSTMEAMLIRILTVRELHVKTGKGGGGGGGGGGQQQTPNDPLFIPDKKDEEEDSE